ncbi:MAG: cell envelope integrity EipB family protein [Alphaproteobacteria bacterium]
MIERLFAIGRTPAITLGFVCAGLGLVVWAGPAGAAEIMPHRALYTMTLGRAGGDAGVIAAAGTMAYQWGETCEGWTVEQRYRLKMGYADSPDVAIVSNFVTWEAKDGLNYRFNQKETRNGTADQEIRGVAKLDGPGKGGTADFEIPPGKSFKLPAGMLFPSAHTIFLIDEAKAGVNFVSKHIFDGATVENAVLVSAVIGPRIAPDPASAKKSPLLDHPGWRVRLAFFPADPKEETPDYELGMLLLDNGVSRDMVIDYGDYAIHAKLDDIEALPKPGC